VIVCKQDGHRRRERGYIAMLSVRRDWRKRGIGTPVPSCPRDAHADPGAEASTLVKRAIAEMTARGADEVGRLLLARMRRFLSIYSDCPRDGVRQRRGALAVRDPRFHARETALPVLPQRQGRLPARAPTGAGQKRVCDRRVSGIVLVGEVGAQSLRSRATVFGA
jgi:hypothetical protein